MKNAKWIYAGLLVLAGGWSMAILAAPKLMCDGQAWAGLLLYRVFALTCHQRSERSFHWCGWPLAVCVRCTGIYAGALLGLLLYPLWLGLDSTHLPSRRYLLLALALLALDWGLGITGLVVHNTGTRLVTGLIVGTVAVFYVMPALLAAIGSVKLPDIAKQV